MVTSRLRPTQTLTVSLSLVSSAVSRAVELSDQKYCSVLATVRAAPAVMSEWRIEG